MASAYDLSRRNRSGTRRHRINGAVLGAFRNAKECAMESLEGTVDHIQVLVPDGVARGQHRRMPIGPSVVSQRRIRRHCAYDTLHAYIKSPVGICVNPPRRERREWRRNFWAFTESAAIQVFTKSEKLLIKQQSCTNSLATRVLPSQRPTASPSADDTLDKDGLWRLRLNRWYI